MVVFDASDIAEVAIRIEENGARFYRHAAGVAGSEALKTLFCRLAEDEEKHGKLFSALRAELTPHIPPESYDGEYTAYLHRYVDDILVFKTGDLTAELAKIRNASDALDFAIRRELDSIFYYQQMGDLLPADRREAVDRIIAEEKNHFKILAAEKERLLP
jgi:rubrerythrin